MGVLAKRHSSSAGAKAAAAPSAGGGLLGTLTPLIEGSPSGLGADDVAGLIGKLVRH
jgi:hypothetical protein